MPSWFCSRFPAGEIDRGTVDVLLGLPVSRRKAYYVEVFAWMLSGMFVLTMGYLGHRTTAPLMPADMRPGPVDAAFVLINLFCVYLAVGAFAFLISANSDRRGRAIGATIALVLCSYLLNFLAQFWEPGKRHFLAERDGVLPPRHRHPIGRIPGRRRRDAALSSRCGCGVGRRSGRAAQYLHDLELLGARDKRHRLESVLGCGLFVCRLRLLIVPNRIEHLLWDI